MESAARGRRDLRAPATVFLMALLVFGVQAIRSYSPQMLYEGDCPYYVSTALSILHDGDLDLTNQLRGGLEVHGRQIALGRHGEWYPKHSILMPVLALPFLGLLGLPGFAVFSVLLLAALACALYGLARTCAPPWPAAGAALLMLFGTFLRRYDYNLTPDVLAALVVTLAVLLLWRSRDRAAGGMFALAAWAKLTNVFLLALAPLYAFWCRRRPGMGRVLLGAAAPIVLLLTFNLVLFGSPFVTSYDRNVLVRDGALVVAGHRGQFDQNAVAGLGRELFDLQHGLLPTSPALWLALPGIVLLFRRHRAQAVSVIVMGEFVLLLFATYRYWDTTRYGNRFLIPVVALAAPPAAMSLEWIVGWLKERTLRSAASWGSSPPGIPGSAGAALPAGRGAPAGRGCAPSTPSSS